MNVNVGQACQPAAAVWTFAVRNLDICRLHFGRLPVNALGDAKEVSSYQPGATPQEQLPEEGLLIANGAIHRSTAAIHPRARPVWSVPHVTFIEFNVIESAHHRLIPSNI